MLRPRFAALLVIPLAILLMGASKIVLTDPDPIAVPAGLKIDDVSKAIKAGIASRTGWTVTKEAPGQIEATLNVRQHMLKVNIPYSTSQVAIKYVDSQNLDYSEKNGVKHIHNKWVGWTRNLTSDIQRELSRVAAK